jgi:hypothetical protein
MNECMDWLIDCGLGSMCVSISFSPSFSSYLEVILIFDRIEFILIFNRIESSRVKGDSKIQISECNLPRIYKLSIHMYLGPFHLHHVFSRLENGRGPFLNYILGVASLVVS